MLARTHLICCGSFQYSQVISNFLTSQWGMKEEMTLSSSYPHRSKSKSRKGGEDAFKSLASSTNF